jgi:phosphoribosylamine-glycine ligase
VFTEYGEIADLAVYLALVEGHDVLLYVHDKAHARIAEGLVPHIKEWWQYLGEGYVWCFDSCSFGNLQDWLRSQGEAVVGGSEGADQLENNRQLGQDWFRSAGFDQPYSQNFTSLDEALSFVEEHSGTKWILKQNMDAPKSISHKGKFDHSEDMIFHLKELKKSWNESDFGKFDCDLMEVVEGLEVAASAFWNGKDWLRDRNGKVVGFLNFEEKKEANDDTGETCGEMGTTFIGVDEDDPLFARILLRPEIQGRLAETQMRGVFDINCIQSEDGRLVALEPTCRFGVPASSYEFIEGLDSPTGELLSALAKGINRTVEIHKGLGMVMCVVGKPFPLDDPELPDESTLMGERLWPLEDGKPTDEFTNEQLRHIHLYNFERIEDDETGEMAYKAPTKNGYLLTVTMRGEDDVRDLRENLIEYIKQNVYIPGQKYRTDIGHRVEGLYEGATR